MILFFILLWILIGFFSFYLGDRMAKEEEKATWEDIHIVMAASLLGLITFIGLASFFVDESDWWKKKKKKTLF